MTEMAMAAHQAKPTETKAKLEMNLSARRHALGQLEQERMKLTLPAHSGDEKAAERLRQVRAEITEQTAVIADIEQALRDIEPRVRGQRASEVLEMQRQRRDRWNVAMDEYSDELVRADAALDVAAAAVKAVVEKQAVARNLLVNLLVRPGPNIEHVMLNKMLAFDSSGFRDPADTAVATLRMLLNPDRDLQSGMASAIVQMRRAGDARIAEMMRRHEGEARAAGAELSAEPEAA